MTSLTTLRNIGNRSALWLESVGIHTAEEVYDGGVVEAYKRVKSVYPDQVTLNMLYALQGALLDLPWNELPRDMKSRFKMEVGE